MKRPADLRKPSTDAITYTLKHNKNTFLSIYHRNYYFEQLKEPQRYFLIGDKGTGKTALAFYYQLNCPEHSVAKLLSIDSTAYKKFIQLKINRKLEYTDYTSIWRTSILGIVSKNIAANEKRWIHRLTGKFKLVELAIKQFDANGMLPEVDTALEFVDSLSFSGEARVSNGPGKVKIESCSDSKVTEDIGVIRHHLYESEIKFKEGLSDLKLENDFVFFMDGLDARPDDVSDFEFMNCLKGLYAAIWELNTNFFNNIKDSKGRVRICMLIRPDIFEQLNAYNSNSRLSDNSVILEWDTTENEYASSALFKVVDKYFVSQNKPTKNGWNDYFPFKNEKGRNRLFVDLIQKSFIRPRDYFAAIGILIDHNNKYGRDKSKFSFHDVFSTKFFREYSDYILGEIKNYCNFYISNDDFSKYINFFKFLNGKPKFDWPTYQDAYKKFVVYADTAKIDRKDFYATPLDLLQFFYDASLIGYYEYSSSSSDKHIHWAYRERTKNMLCPKVKEGSHYLVFNGVKKSIDIGKSFEK